MKNGVTVFMKCMIEVEGHTQELSLGLCGTYENNRAYDLAWDEAWVQKYFDADLFYDEFMSLCYAEAIDNAYEAHKGRELNR